MIDALHDVTSFECRFAPGTEFKLFAVLFWRRQIGCAVFFRITYDSYLLSP